MSKVPPEMQLRTGWFTSGLPGAECSGRTYCLVPINRLPAIRLTFNDDFSWLPRVPQPLDWSITTETWPAGDAAFLARISSEPIELPSSFVAMVAAPQLRWSVRSGTGCWWSLDADALQPLPTSELLAARFLTDQQEVLFWYLLLDGTQEPPVVVSHQDFSAPETWEPLPLDHVYRCAPSFDVFMYRYWIENEIAFRSVDGEALSTEQLRYLDEARRLSNPRDYGVLSD
jgi:hypothetical protein